MPDFNILTDDFTGSTGAGWDNTKWGASNVGGGVINQDGSGRGRISVNTNGAASKATNLIGDYDDQEALFKIMRVSGSQNVKYYLSPVADYPTAASSSFPFAEGVWVEGVLNSPTNLTLKSARAGVVTTGPTISGLTLTTTAFLAVRIRKEGTWLRVRTWAAIGTEPSTWDAEWDMGANAPTAGGSGWRRTFVGLTSATSGSFELKLDSINASRIESTVPVNYSATPATFSAMAPQPTVLATKTKNIAAQPATFSLSAVDPTVDAKVYDKNKTVTAFQINGITEGLPTSVLNANVDGYNLLGLDARTSTKNHVMLAPSLGLPADASIGATELQVYVNSSTAVTLTFRVQSIDAPYDPATVNWNNQPAKGAIQTPTKTSGSGYKTFDVTEIVKAIQAGTAYGMVLVATSSDAEYNISTGLGGGSNPPTMSMAYASEGATTITATPATFSVAAVDPAFSNATNKTVNASPATLSLSAVNPVVSVVSHIDVQAEPALFSVDLFPGSNFSVPTRVDATPATLSLEAVEATVATERNAIVRATPATFSMLMLAPLEAQVETDDPYFNWVSLTTDSDDYWYRLDEVSGNTLSSRYSQSERDDTADLVGAYAFGEYGPEGRKAIHMENGYFKPRTSRRIPGKTYPTFDPTPKDTYGGVSSVSGEFTFELVMRTTDLNGIIAYGLDQAADFAMQYRSAIFLKNGRVNVTHNRLDMENVGGTFEVTGFKNIADGEWHHIVVTHGEGNAKRLDNGLRVYIDGKLDIRKDIPAGMWVTPDTYFGMPDSARLISKPYPWVDNLTADVMEVVTRLNSDVTQDTVNELFYATFGIVPVRVQAATFFVEAPDAKGKGNQKRVLVLYTDRDPAYSTIGNERSTFLGLDNRIPDEFDHDIQIGRIYEPGESPWIDLVGFRVVAVPIMREDGQALTGGFTPYRDPVTDLPRLLDLQHDIDLDAIDVIMFKNWPDEGTETEIFATRGYENSALNDFLDSVKQAVVDGKGLEVTNINLASRLGLISGAQPIPMLYDKRDAFNETDARASSLDVFNSFGEKTLDLHANQWHRVTASIPNLTDVFNSEYISDAMMSYNDGNNFDVTNKWAYKLTNAPLSIGTELLDITGFWNRVFTYTEEDDYAAFQWDKFVWAVTPNGLLAGTPVYKFSDKMWKGNTQVDNPYKDFIGGAVVQPGDTWGGVRIAGKVFMNFAEAPWNALEYGTMTRQIVPPNSEIANPVNHETVAMRDWDYSWSRIAYASNAGPQTDNQLVLVDDNAGGSYYVVQSKNSLGGITIMEKYPTETVPVPSWAHRGLLWLSVTEEVSDGSVVIRPTAAQMSLSISEPVVRAERSTNVHVEAALMNLRAVNPEEVVDPDVTVNAFPATFGLTVTGYGKTISVAPAEFSIEVIDNFELVAAGGEQVVLYLHALREVELYMEVK